MMNSLEWLIAYFGIVRTGAWAVPLNFRFTGDDIRYCVEVAEPKAMIFSEEFTERIDAAKDAMPGIRHYLFVGKKTPSYAEPLEKALASAPAKPPAIEITYDDPCGLYFTSGTTGRPKPILLTHKNMACACVTENMAHHQTKKDTFILIPPLYHTGAKMHWFGSFIVGGRGGHPEGRDTGVRLRGRQRGTGNDRLSPRPVGPGYPVEIRQRGVEAG